MRAVIRVRVASPRIAHIIAGELAFVSALMRNGDHNRIRRRV